MKKRSLNDQEVRWLLSLKHDDIDRNFLINNFAVVGDAPSAKFNTFDTFTLKRGQYFNSTDIETTIGRYIFNLFALPDAYLKKFGFENRVIKKGDMGDIEEKLADMLLNDEIDPYDYADYLDDAEWLAMSLAYFIVPTMNFAINVPVKSVIKKRDELFDQYAEDIAKGDPNIAKKIENEVLELARSELKKSGNEAYAFFDSKYFDFENNYKKSSIMAGAIENPFTHKLDILKSNYVNGASKEDFPIMSNNTILGGYSRGVETEAGGYETKKINNALQIVQLGEPGSDCGTTFYLTTKIEPKMATMFVNRYILDGGKLVLLNADNIKKYVGKEVKLRSPLFCHDEHICNKCAGELFYKMGVKNAGLLTSTFSGSMMSAIMKKFHDTSVKFTEIVAEDYIK